MKAESKFLDRHRDIRRVLWVIGIVLISYIQQVMIILGYEFWIMFSVCCPVYLVILSDIVRIEMPLEERSRKE